MIDCCNNNLNRGSLSQPALTEDLPVTINVSESSTVVLAADPNRKLVKIYVVSSSGLCWIRYGAGASLGGANCAHPLLQGHLLIIDSQAKNAVSAICSSGAAQLRVSSAF
jgi:hypothetical protein